MQQRSYLYTSFISLFLLLQLFTSAQTFRYSQYTTHQGLPIDNVYAAAQDSNGFIWFGTDFGIARYDGYRFTNYGHSNGLATKAVTDIVYAGGDSLLFFSYPFAIQSIHYNGKINTITNKAGIALQQLVKHAGYYLYYARGGKNYGFLQNGVVKIINADSAFGITGIQINCIFSAGEKKVAFCTNKGLFIKNETGTTLLMNAENIEWGLYTSQKKILVVNSHQLMEVTEDLVIKKTPISLPTDLIVYHMAEEKNGAIWLRGLDKGIYQIYNNELQDMSAKLRMENKLLNEFFSDTDGNFWFCTDGAGILLKKRSGFINYETQDGLANNKVLRLLKQNDEIFIGTSNGLSVMKDNKITTIGLPQTGKGLKYVFQLFPVTATVTGICMDQTFTFDKGSYVTESIVKGFSYNDHQFRAFNTNFAWQQDEDNSWLLSAGSLAHLQKGKEEAQVFNLKPLQVKKGYCMTAINNELWLGTDAGIIVINDHIASRLDTIGHEKLGQVLSFLTDKNNRLWIATDVGLFIYANRQFEAVAKGSTTGSNYCTAITADAAGRIWVSTWDGIFYTDGKTKKYLNTNDGLPSKTANCILYDSAEQRIYIGLDNGLATLTGSASTNKIPGRDIFVSCNIAGNESNLVNNSSSLSPSQNSLVFYLSFPYYQGSEDLVYEYKMDNGNWTTTITPSVVINDMGSGKHIFYARAIANGEVISKDNTSFTFTIKTPYYKTWWFWVIAALILQFLIFRIFNHYNKKAREEKLAEQSQKAEYASLKQQAFTLLMNPHFIFNALNSVQHYVNKQDRQSANKYLSDFATLIRRSFDASQRSFVTLDEELETIRLYLQLEKMRFVEKFDYTINISAAAAEEDWMLPSMMLQPFLENAVLHGLMPLTEKGLLTIEATAVNNSLCITITDNGVGMEKSKALRSGSKHNSKGMQLIKERIELLSKLSKEPIQLSITELSPGAHNPGTKIIMIIPQEVYTVFQKQRNQA